MTMKPLPMPYDPSAAVGAHKRSAFARLREWIWDVEAPTREEARRRILSKPGFFESMSPETLAYLQSYDGPEHLGLPPTEEERRDLDKRLPARDDRALPSANS